MRTAGVMKKKILLVDDVRLFLKLEETFFKRTGCEILQAESGAKAVELAQLAIPDLILLDYIMPDMMGDEVIKRLKAASSTRSIPIIMVSTSASEEDMNKCFDAGADEYVTKPINAQELLVKAANLLEIPQRAHFRKAVYFRVEGEAAGRTFFGYSKNLSPGGMLLECLDEIAPEARVAIDLPILADQGVLKLTGRVARRDRDELNNTYNLGVQFVELSPEQRRDLDRFLSRAAN